MSMPDSGLGADRDVTFGTCLLALTDLVVSESPSFLPALCALGEMSSGESDRGPSPESKPEGSLRNLQGHLISKR